MNSLLLALQITALGMGLVFAALILLWGLMNLLTALTADKGLPAPQEIAASSPAGADPAMDSSARARAAAIAVVIAMAERQASSSVHPFHESPTTVVSAWQLGMRTRQMYQKGVSIRRRTG